MRSSFLASLKSRFGRLSIAGLLAAGPARAQVAVPGMATEAAPLVIRGATVIDVEKGSRVSDQTLVIAGNRIRALGPTSTIAVPPTAHVVDGRGTKAGSSGRTGG